MAYSGKVSLNNIYEVWTYIIRFITEDSATAGKDWQILKSELLPYSNNLERKKFQGTLTSVALDTWINLPTISVFDYSFGTKITGEVVGTGDGTTTSFNYTVANTPIGIYSVEIHYTISGSNYIAYDDGNGNISGTSVSGTIDYTTGNLSLTFSTAPDNGTNITIDYLHDNLTEGTDYQIDTVLGKVQFLSTGSVSAGSDVDYFYNFRLTKLALKNTGLADQDDVQFGLEILVNTQETYCAIKGFLYEYIDTGNNQYIGQDGDRAVAFWNNPVDLWLFSNKQRIIIVIKSESYYSSMYIGFAHRLHSPNEYKQPLILVASHQNDGSWGTYVNYNAETDDARAFILTRRYYYKAEDGNIYYADYDNVVGRHLPHLKDNGANLYTINYPQSAQKHFYSIMLVPKSKERIIGYYDGVYIILDADLTAESVITDQNSKTYIAIPDVFRASFKAYYLILEE